MENNIRIQYLHLHILILIKNNNNSYYLNFIWLANLCKLNR